jgi:hypothetical protein
MLTYRQFSLEGKLISDLPIGQKQFELNLPSQSGIYFIRILSEDGLWETKKCIKQ